MSRNGLMRWSGSCASAAAAARAVFNELTIFTTPPLLMNLVFTREWTEYQLINAKAVPLSFSEIQVPPPGSDGARTRHPLISLSVGGSPMARANASLSLATSFCSARSCCCCVFNSTCERSSSIAGDVPARPAEVEAAGDDPHGVGLLPDGLPEP